jgi:hypothetical protein
MKKLARMQQPDCAVRDLYDAMFGNTVRNLSCIADTGADMSVLSETFVNKVKNLPSVRYEPLASPLELKLLGEVDNRPMVLVQIAWVTLPILVCLHCGPLRVPDWRFAMVRCKLDEGILGKVFLTQILGLDLGKLFEKARLAASAADSATLVEPTEVSSKPTLAYLGVKYFGQEETSEDLDRLLGAGFGIENEAEIHTALDELVQRAKANGVTDHGADTLHRLVREFRDVWAMKLGPGAPADVPPMRVQLQSGARPRRAAPRRRPEQGRTESAFVCYGEFKQGRGMLLCTNF